MISYIIIIVIGILFGLLNSLYWYKQGYKGGKLFFMGSIAFIGIGILVFQLFDKK